MKADGKKGRVENRVEAVRDRKAAARVHKDPWGAPHGRKKKSSGQGPQGPLGRTAREENEEQRPGSTRTPGAHRAGREGKSVARVHKDPWGAPHGKRGKSSGQGPQGPLGRTAQKEKEEQRPGSTRTPGTHRAVTREGGACAGKRARRTRRWPRRCVCRNHRKDAASYGIKRVWGEGAARKGTGGSRCSVTREVVGTQKWPREDTPRSCGSANRIRGFTDSRITDPRIRVSAGATRGFTGSFRGAFLNCPPGFMGIGRIGSGSRFRVQCSGFMVHGLGFRAWRSWFRMYGLGFRAYGSRCRV